MKLKIYIITAILFLLFTGCPIDIEYSIRIYNQSNSNIYVYAAYILPDTLLPTERPNLIEIAANQKHSSSISDNYVNDIRFKRLEKGDTLTIFILDKNVIDNNLWNTVRANNMILKRFNFNRSKGYEIYYPACCI
ncbi:MAG: hypothetical protein LBH32_12850 [Dysgonamonadaceae bacterium]|jgi:hypothetical protein|nr:hypothetical protein [Dysgonamonadaceae bacterium]